MRTEETRLLAVAAEAEVRDLTGGLIGQLMNRQMATDGRSTEAPVRAIAAVRCLRAAIG